MMEQSIHVNGTDETVRLVIKDQIVKNVPKCTIMIDGRRRFTRTVRNAHTTDVLAKSWVGKPLRQWTGYVLIKNEPVNVWGYAPEGVIPEEWADDTC